MPDRTSPHGDFASVYNPERAASLRACDIDPERVPIKSIIPKMGELPGLGIRKIYEIDLKRLTPIQRHKMAAYLAERFGYTVEDVEKYIDSIGIPLLCEDVVAISTVPAKYL